jgi:hypothetical protein
MDEVIYVCCLKACTVAEAAPGNSQCHNRLPGTSAAAKPATAHPGGPAANKRFSFSDPLVSPPSAQAPPGGSLGTVFLSPCNGVFARPGLAAPSLPPQTRYQQRQQTLRTRLDNWPLLLQANDRARGGGPCGGVFWITEIPLYTATAT